MNGVMNKDLQKEIARAILTIGAVGFRLDKPVTFVSGIQSPVYTDNRIFPFWPEEWRKVIRGFQQLISDRGIVFDVVAGIATAGIPHSAALGFAMNKPSVSIRKEAKDHGAGKRIEGGSIKGKTILLVEDLVTTGNSSLSGIEAVRNEGGIVNDCLIIVSYGFKESGDAFQGAYVNLHALTTFKAILAEALAEGQLSESDARLVEDWLADPKGWAKRHDLE